MDFLYVVDVHDIFISSLKLLFVVFASVSISLKLKNLKNRFRKDVTMSVIRI